jgi:hypothetical protein
MRKFKEIIATLKAEKQDKKLATHLLSIPSAKTFAFSASL